jgi:hypothetical protein
MNSNENNLMKYTLRTKQFCIIDGYVMLTKLQLILKIPKSISIRMDCYD